MNPRERWGLLLIDEFPDRPPVYPLVTSHAARVYDCNLIEYCTDGRILAEAQMEAQRTYGHEGLSVFTDVGIIAEAIGSRYHLREFEVPILDQPLITDGAMIADLRIPDPATQGRLPVYLEAVDRMYRAAGDILPIFAFIPCPFTTAAGLRGTEEFLMDTVLEPQQTHQLLDISLQAAIRFSDECILAGALPMLVDPLASGSVLSRETYSRFAQPYQQKLIAHLHRYDLDVTLHVCGDTTPMLDLIPETGADLFSFDQVGVTAVSEAMGKAVRLVGNWPPHALLSTSNFPVDQGTADILETGLRNPKGFVLSTGCEVPIRCDCEKLQTLISIGKDARYEHGW